MHKVPDNALITATNIARCENEAAFDEGSDVFWALFQNSDGKYLGHGVDDVDPMQTMFAKDMLLALNNHLHHDGAWLIVFSVPVQQVTIASMKQPTVFQRFTLLWMDKDGDIQFPLMCERPFEEYLAQGPDPLINLCETSWAMNREARKKLDLKPHETYRRSLGELPASPTRH